MSALEQRKDARYAEALLSRGHLLHPNELEWLRRWQAQHENDAQVTVGQARGCDLGISMSGLDVIGGRDRYELRVGNVNVAGGWGWRVFSLQDEQGWNNGWGAQLSGMDAFLEAMGLQFIDGAEDMLGPFHDEYDWRVGQELAVAALLKRMLAALVVVSRAALEPSDAEERIQSQAPTADEESLSSATEASAAGEFDPASWSGDVSDLHGYEPRLCEEAELCDRTFATKREAFLAGLALGRP